MWIYTLHCIAEYANFLAFSVNVLEGISVDDEMKEFATSLGVKMDAFKAYCHTAGAILWCVKDADYVLWYNMHRVSHERHFCFVWICREFAKGNPVDSSVVSVTLQQLGLAEDISDLFAVVCNCIFIFTLSHTHSQETAMSCSLYPPLSHPSHVITILIFFNIVCFFSVTIIIKET